MVRILVSIIKDMPAESKYLLRDSYLKLHTITWMGQCDIMNR
jgi:hypothetical protein